MNRRGFITSAFKATIAGLLVPEHLFGRAMVAGFHPRIYYGEHITMGIDPAFDLELMEMTLSFATLKPGEKTLYVSPSASPDFREAYEHIIKIVETS